MRYRGIFDLFKKGLVILVTLTSGLHLTGAVAAADTTVVSISAPGQVISAGDHFTVSIIVEPGNAMAGVQFNLNFDPTLVAVDDVEEGDLLIQDGASTFFIPGTVDNVAGNISGVAGAIISPGQTVSAGGTFAIISLLKLTDDKACFLDLSNVVVGDMDGSPLPASVVDGSVNLNHSPILDPIGDKSVGEGELLTFTVTATDPDDDLSYSALNLPPGASFDPLTQTFSWTPGYDQSGVYPAVHFEVSDGVLNDSEDITITVSTAEQPHNNYDVNGDGVVNAFDLIRIIRHLRERGPDRWIPEDVNGDGAVNVLDIIQTVQNWTRGHFKYHRRMH